MISSISVASRPPYSFGQEIAPHPPSYNVFCHFRKNAAHSPCASGSARFRLRPPPGRFSSSHLLHSWRTASSCLEIEKSLCLPASSNYSFVTLHFYYISATHCGRALSSLIFSQI